MVARFLKALCVVGSVGTSPVLAQDPGEGGVRVTVTVGRPTVVPVSGSRTATLGTRRLIVTVDTFEASAAGPVTAAVIVRCGGKDQELGRFGIFPDVSFVTSDQVEPLRFAFDLPSDVACTPIRDVVISLEPGIGGGAGASMTIGSAVIE